MPDGRHRKLRRKSGVALKPSQGKRRTSGAVVAPTADELAQEARDHRVRTARSRILAALVVAAALFGGAVLLGTYLGDRDTAAGDDLPGVVTTVDGSSVLVVVMDGEEGAASIALVSAAEAPSPRVVLFHPALLTVLPGFGENTLQNAGRFNGGELVELAIANLLGVRIDARIDLDQSTIESLVSDGLDVDLPVPLVIAEGDGERVAVGAGAGRRDAGTVGRLVTDTGVDDQLALLQRQGAVWDALLQRMAEDPGLVEGFVRNAAAGRAAATTALVATAGADRRVITVVPATSLEPAGDIERYQLDGGVADEFVAESIPYLSLAATPRIRVEVLNGNGQIGATRPVAANLIRRGYRIILTDNADRSDHPDTRIIAQGREHQQAALAVREIIGLGEVSLEARQPSGVVDLTIIVGRDLPGQDG